MVRLTTTELADDEFEVRYWVVESDHTVSGSVFARRAGVWQVHALLLPDYNSATIKMVEVPEPPDGWEVFWQGLQDAGLLTMEDPNPGRVGRVERLDGTDFIVEANIGGRYKSFIFDWASDESPLRNQMGDIVWQMQGLLEAGELKEGQSPLRNYS